MVRAENSADSEVKGRYYAERYNYGCPREERILRSIRLFRSLRGERLLDVGCGDGAVTVALKEAMNARQAFGVEIAPEGAAAARARGVEALQLDIDGHDLPFEDDFFDAAYCGEIIEHLFDTDHLLAEVRRVLKPGGVCVLTTPNLAGWANRTALLLGFQPYPMAVSPRHEAAGKLLASDQEGQWGHVRVFTLRALRELITQASLPIESVQGCPVTINTRHWLVPLIRAVDGVLARWPSLANRVMVVMRKG
ncbi:MAG: class I SAM-dependent methyltransferase [Chloroflexi bacterium]|nr:class I SAM-dependent methyltransferase [Chloroflexota bacterium]